MLGCSVATLQGQAGPWYSCRWKNIHGAVGCLACLYSRVDKPRMLQTACLSACLMSWPLLPGVAPIVTPVPLRVSHLFKYWRETTPAKCQELHNVLLCRRAHFTVREHFMRPSPEAMRTLIIRCLQGCGNTASLSYPDTWVRKPDCLHLPYTN